MSELEILQTNPVQLSFDYGELDTPSQVLVMQRTTEIKTLARRTIEGQIELGRKLLEVRSHLSDDQWQRWLSFEFHWSITTATRLTNVAKRFPEIPPNFQLTALYELSADSVEPSARQEAIARAELGETIDRTTAKEIRDRHAPKQTAIVDDSGAMAIGDAIETDAIKGEIKSFVGHTGVVVRTEDGEEITVSRQQLSGDDLAPERGPRKEPPPSSVELLEASLEIAEARIELLERHIIALCVAHRGGKLTDAIVDQVLVDIGEEEE